MKQKLLNALKRDYKNLGLDGMAFERVAAFGETFITADEQIESFVKAAEPMLKAEQSAADRVRSELNAKLKAVEGEKAELEAKLKGKNTEEKTTEPEEVEKPNFEELIAKAVSAAVTPLQEKLNAFETAQAHKSAVGALDDLRNTWDYAKRYSTESADAYEQVMELYEVGGKKWNADELTAKFKEKFSKAVKKKGVDTNQPLEGDGDVTAKPDFSKELEMLREAGVDLPE